MVKIITLTLHSFFKQGIVAMVISPAFWLRSSVILKQTYRRLFDLTGGNKNFNPQYFLMSIYGYFTSLQKRHHPGLAIGCLVVTNARTNQ